MISNAGLHLVESVDDAQAFLRWLSQSRPILAIDTETSGLRPYAGDFVRMVQFGDGGDGWALSSRRWYGVIEQALRSIQADRLPTVFHNPNFDLHFMDRVAFPLPAMNRVHDIYTMDHLLNPLLPHKLKMVAERHWPGAGAGEAVLKEYMRKNRLTWATVPEDAVEYWGYAAIDTVITARLAEELLPKVNNLGLRDAYDREMAVRGVAWRMEKRGIRVDLPYVAQLLEVWRMEIEQLTAELNDLGVRNPNANKQIAQALQLTESWEPDEWTATGVPKLDSAILKGIDSEISRRILRYRRLTKWSSAYLENFLREADAEGRIHPSINTLQARTGRMSYSNPSFQNIPRSRAIHRAIIPSEGNVIYTVDYDSMEARVFSHYAGDQGLIDACNADVDIHTYSARLMYRDPEIGKKDPRRQAAKNGRFCRIYGGGPAKLADTIGVTEAQAREFIANDDITFPGIRTFMRSVEAAARDRQIREGTPYVISVGGRRLAAPSDGLYKLTNYLIQGGCADVLKMKIVEMDAAGLEPSTLLYVHDETVLDVPAGPAGEEIANETARIMGEEEMFRVPLTCAPEGPFNTWGDKYPDD